MNLKFLNLNITLHKTELKVNVFNKLFKKIIIIKNRRNAFNAALL